MFSIQNPTLISFLSFLQHYMSIYFSSLVVHSVSNLSHFYHIGAQTLPPLHQNQKCLFLFMSTPEAPISFTGMLYAGHPLVPTCTCSPFPHTQGIRHHPLSIPCQSSSFCFSLHRPIVSFSCSLGSLFPFLFLPTMTFPCLYPTQTGSSLLLTPPTSVLGQQTLLYLLHL